MTITRAALAFGLAAVFAPPALAAECALERLTTVRTEPLPDGRIRIPVTVQDRALSLLVDTGGVSTTVKWEQVRSLGLPVTQTDRRILGTAGSLLNFTINGERFSIGGLRVRNLPIYLESRPVNGADGTLGPDLLRAYDVEIDFARSSLSLLSPNHCAGTDRDGAAVIAMDVTETGHLRFPVRVDGATIMATLDTGSAISVVSMQAAAALGVYPASPALALLHDGGRYRIHAYPFRTLDFGGVSVSNPSIVIASGQFLPGMGNDLILGVDALRQLHLIIAYGDRRLYVKGAQPH